MIYPFTPNIKFFINQLLDYSKVNDKLEKATKKDLIDAAYHYLTKPWYKKPTQFISIVGTLAAIITAFTSLYVAFLSQEKARNAINEVKVTGRDITKVASEIAQPLEDIFCLYCYLLQK